MKKKKEKSRFSDFDLITTKKLGIITFGTNVFLRKDKLALKIVFPCGEILDFKPEEEIKK
jgi:hypothetical protein